MTQQSASNDHAAMQDTLYIRNMNALFRSDAELAQRIDECEPDGSVQMEPAKRGGKTASVSVACIDRKLYVHSRIDPEGEAKRFADAVKVDSNFCFVVGGFGLGYHIRALADRLKGDAFIIVTEPNLHLLKAALETVDLSTFFMQGRCIILTRTDKANIQTKLEPNNTLMMMGAQFVTHQPSEQINKTFQAQMRKIIADYMTYCRMTLMTLVANSRTTCRNVANNFPAYLSTPPIDMLRNRFKGIPAIVVSAGPSLRNQLDQLAELQGRAVIITVQTTFKTLLDRGIRPNFVTSLDYHEMSKRFFEDIGDYGNTHLVAEPKVTWHVLDKYAGPTSVLYNSFAEQCLGKALTARDGLKAGATVSHLSFYLAVYMGCDPIIMTGQDLAYTNHVYYTPGVAIHGLWRPQLNRFCSIEMMEWERIVRSRNILMKVKDINGQEIYTDEQLFTYLQQFEGDFATVPGRVIDATGGGVRKAGMRVMPLKDVAEQYCRNPIPQEQISYHEQVRWHDTSKLEAGRSEIAKRIEEIDKVVEICQEMKALLEELTDLLDEPAKFNRRIADVDKLRVKIRTQDRTYQLIAAVSQHAELQRFTADRRLKLSEAEGVELARQQLERDRKFVDAIIDGADVLKEILEGSLERFDISLAKAEHQ